MIFFIILLAVAIAATVLFGVSATKKYGDTKECLSFFAWVTFIVAAALSIFLAAECSIAHTNKTKYQSHLENPTQYTYEQLAEHNEEVTKHRAWQGTIFSFYNGVDLSNVDIDNVSHKAIVGE